MLVHQSPKPCSPPSTRRTVHTSPALSQVHDGIVLISGDIKYKDVVNMIKNAAALTVELSKNRKVTFFMEYVANEIFLTTFQRYFPDASIVVLKKTGKEKRRRLYVALGFSLQSLQAEVDKRTQKAQGELGHLPFTFTIETRPTEVSGSLTPSSYCELLPFLPQNRSSLF